MLQLALLHVVADGLPQVFLAHVPQQRGRHKVLDAPCFPGANTKSQTERVSLCVLEGGARFGDRPQLLFRTVKLI